jgi:hypothetical protein
VGALKKGAQAIGWGQKGVGTNIHVGLSAQKIHRASLSPSQHTDMKAFPLALAAR